MVTECAQYKKLKKGCRTKSKTQDADWDQWAQFVGIADKGAKLKEACSAPLNKAITYWGHDIVGHYGFAKEGLKYCKLLGTTTSRIHLWKEAQSR
jgi:hypothetical protein